MRPQPISADRSKLAPRVTLSRCGEWVGRAAAGVIILATLSFAVAALVADIL